MGKSEISLSERNCRNVNVRWAKQSELLRKHVERIPRTRYLLLKTRLNAFLAGDGSVFLRRKNSRILHYAISFYPDEKNMLDCYLAALKELYLKEPRVDNRGMYYSVRTVSKFAVLDLLRDGNFGSMSWRVLLSLLKNRRLKIEWLRAFFDCESHVARKCIQLQGVNRVGIYQIKDLLGGIGIDSRIYEYDRKKENWNMNYILCIAPKENRQRYLNTVGFNNLKKLESLKKRL